MNERLKELYLRAHSIRHYDNDPSLAGNPPTVYWQGEVSAQRFAELLIRECEKVAKDGPWYYDSPSCGWRNPINFVCNEMKEHFGVK